MSDGYKPLDHEGCLALAEALGDTAETVISVHRLRNGFCRAYTADDVAIVQDNFCLTEPTAFGLDPEVIWDLLGSVVGWDCVNVSSECAMALGKIIEREMGVQVRYYGDVYHVLNTPVVNFRNKAVRQLTLADLGLLESAQEEVQGAGFGNPRGMLSEGIAACAIVSDGIVGIAHTSARTDRYADIGAFTLEGWRGRGFATAAASIVARRVQESGQIPTWSAGEDNFASLRVAQKLGFIEVFRRTYLIPQQMQNSY